MTAADLLASGLGWLRRTGALLVAAGVAIGLLLAGHAAPVGHRIDGGGALRPAATAAPAGPAR